MGISTTNLDWFAGFLPSTVSPQNHKVSLWVTSQVTTVQDHRVAAPLHPNASPAPPRALRWRNNSQVVVPKVPFLVEKFKGTVAGDVIICVYIYICSGGSLSLYYPLYKICFLFFGRVWMCMDSLVIKENPVHRTVHHHRWPLWCVDSRCKQKTET